jgi:hypothetical protein
VLLALLHLNVELGLPQWSFFELVVSPGVFQPARAVAMRGHRSLDHGETGFVSTPGQVGQSVRRSHRPLARERTSPLGLPVCRGSLG